MTKENTVPELRIIRSNFEKLKTTGAVSIEITPRHPDIIFPAGQKLSVKMRGNDLDHIQAFVKSHSKEEIVLEK